MKKKLSILHYFALFCISCLGTNYGISQTTVSASVMVVVTQGPYSYAILSETNTSNLYHTSAFYSTQGYLATNQQVQISFDDPNDKTQGDVIASTVSNVFCFLNTTSTNNTFNSSNNLPYVSNGILFFDDQDHIIEVHDWLEHLIDSLNIETNDVLDVLENQLTGFSSFRTKLNMDFGLTQGGMTNQEMDEYLEVDFIRDEILKTFINTNRMIGIDDSVFFMKGENVILGMDANDNNLIAGVAALPDSLDVFGEGGIIALSGNPLGFNIYSPLINSYHRDKIEVNDTISYQTFASVIKEPCAIFKRSISVDLYQESDAGTLLYNPIDPIWDLEEPVRTLTIDWGDDIVEVIENYDNDHAPIPHTYSESGVYFPITKYEFTDKYGDLQTAYDTSSAGISISYIQCSNLEEHEVEYLTSGNYRMVSELFIQHNVVFKQIGAKTTFYEYKSGAWEREKADVYAKVEGTFLDDETCQVKEYKHENKLRYSQKDVQSDKSKLWRGWQIANGDIKSRHYCVKGALLLQIELVLNPC
jgi:hypothetical protein